MGSPSTRWVGPPRKRGDPTATAPRSQRIDEEPVASPGDQTEKKKAPRTGISRPRDAANFAPSANSKAMEGLPPLQTTPRVRGSNNQFAWPAWTAARGYQTANVAHQGSALSAGSAALDTQRPPDDQRPPSGTGKNAACDAHDGDRTMKMAIIKAATVLDAADKVPWAQVLVKSERGWIAFDSLASFHDFKTAPFEVEIPEQSDCG